MSIFKKSIKHSKGSKDLDNKIKSLDEELKKTGAISVDSVNREVQIFAEEKKYIPEVFDKIILTKQEEKLYNWRESFLEESEIKEENVKEKPQYTSNLPRVEKVYK